MSEDQEERKAKHPGGRPSKFKPEYIEQAKKLCELGATDEDLANFFDVTTVTIWRWQVAHSEFCSALKMGKDSADNRVERSLYHRAIGYTHDAMKVMQHQGSEILVPYKEHVPPDVTACIFWLKNRRKDQWRDKSEHGFTDENGKPVAPVLNVFTGGNQS